MKEEVIYVAKRYSKGKFSVDQGWKRLNIKPAFKWNSLKIAVAIASFVVLSSTAAIIYHQYDNKHTSADAIEERVQPTTPVAVIKVIDFEDVQLPTVISKIKEVYGVDVINVPENAENYRLSLHYEGNVVELVATINEILQIKMAVKE